MENQNSEEAIPQLFILKAKSGQWMWEIDLPSGTQACAGFESEGDAIEDAHDTLSGYVEKFNMVFTKSAGD